MSLDLRSIDGLPWPWILSGVVLAAGLWGLRQLRPVESGATRAPHPDAQRANFEAALGAHLDRCLAYAIQREATRRGLGTTATAAKLQGLAAVAASPVLDLTDAPGPADWGLRERIIEEAATALGLDVAPQPGTLLSRVARACEARAATEAARRFT